MKKNILVFIFIFQAIIAFSQAWTSIGIKVGGGTTFLINNNLLNDHGYTHEFGKTYNYGAKFGLNFGEHTSITFDAMISKHQQPFNYIDTYDVLQHNTITWDNLDLYLMYRNHSSGAYLEIGPMVSLVRGIQQIDTGVGINAATDVSNFYKDKYFSGVLGVGSYMIGADKFTTMIGLRIHYAIDDFISKDGKNPENFAFAFPNTSGPVSKAISTSPASTNPLFVEFIVEFNFGLGFFAKAACSNRIAWFGGN